MANTTGSPQASKRGPAASGMARRDVLKLGAAAAVGVSSLALGDRLPSQAVNAAPRAGGDYLPAHNFRVEIDGVALDPGAVQTVLVEPLAIDERELTTGADWDYRVYGPGDAHYGSITIRARVGKDSKALYEWFQEAATGNTRRKSISVIILTRDGKEARSFNYLDCFPTRWDPGDYSPSSNVACESITCKMGRVELA